MASVAETPQAEHCVCSEVKGGSCKADPPGGRWGSLRGRCSDLLTADTAEHGGRFRLLLLVLTLPLVTPFLSGVTETRPCGRSGERGPGAPVPALTGRARPRFCSPPTHCGQTVPRAADRTLRSWGWALRSARRLAPVPPGDSWRAVLRMPGQQVSHGPLGSVQLEKLRALLETRKAWVQVGQGERKSQLFLTAGPAPSLERGGLFWWRSVCPSLCLESFRWTREVRGLKPWSPSCL